MKKKALLLMLFLMFLSTNALSQNYVQGKISGAVQAGISVELYKTGCGGDLLVDTFISNSAGYYGFGCLDDGNYRVVPNNPSYLFSPEFINVQVPQTEIQSYDFSATIIPPCDLVDRFLDNGDGTVTDCRTSLIWLKNANCYGSQSWDNAISSAATLNSGECGLSDSSIEGDWHLATRVELEGIGTDPPEFWDTGYPVGTWTVPGLPFVNVQSSYYWSGTGIAENYSWFVLFFGGYAYFELKTQPFYAWPVRSAD